MPLAPSGSICTTSMQLHLIDNYDSFTGNLVHYLEVLSDNSLNLWQNDAPSFDQVFEADALILSPGPGLPNTSGRLMEILGQLPADLPVLGICLGMQALGQLTGEHLEQLPVVAHGQEDHLQLAHENHWLFQGIKAPIQVGRYHSWAFKQMHPLQWQILAHTSDGACMAAVHQSKPWTVLQFHPESVMTPGGFQMLQNWLCHFCQEAHDARLKQWSYLS